MTRFLSVVLLIALCAVAVAPAATAPAPERPRLILLLIMDQFRQDFITRHRASFVPGGYNLLLERGAVFANANYEYALTLTAPGHTVIATGSYPNHSGIVGNEWFDRATNRMTTADRDTSVELVGAEQRSPGSSPHWLNGSAFADELKMMERPNGRVIAISEKARSAVLPGGRGADAAYWFEAGTGHVISSTWYMKDLPEWVRQWNAKNWVDQYAGQPWLPVDNPKGEPFTTFPKGDTPADHRKLATAVTDSTFVTDAEFELARGAVENEKLGAGKATDLLSISVSATDLVGHDYGPDSPRTRDTILRADRAIAGFLRFLDSRVGLSHVWIAFTADHGVAPMPEVAKEERIDAGRVAEALVMKNIEDALNRAFPAPGGSTNEKWIQSYIVPNLYLNQSQIRRRQLRPAEVAQEAARAVAATPGFAAAFTREELENCHPGTDIFGMVCRSWYPERSGDVYMLFKPFWMYELRDNRLGTTHGTPYSFDTHVPLILVGSAFRAGTYYTRASPADISVTLAALLGMDAPALASGRVLSEALISPAPMKSGPAKPGSGAASK